MMVKEIIFIKVEETSNEPKDLKFTILQAALKPQ